MSGFLQKLLKNLSVHPAKDKSTSKLSQDTRPTALKIENTLKLSEPIPTQWQVGIGYSTGRQRDHNEDAIFTLTSNLLSDATSFPFGLYIVADGMGGHRYGEVASSLAVRTMAGHVIEKLYSLLVHTPPTGATESIQQIMKDGIQIAHREIIQQVEGGGTTLTALLLLSDQMTLAHVGDSRAYAITPTGQFNLLTRDHSLVKRLVELGQISSEEAAVHPQRNVLYRALGQGEPFNAEAISAPVPTHGHLLICSDGLWGVLSEEAIWKIISAAADPVRACQRLIAAANEAGGPDNIAVILVRLPS